MFLPLNPSIPVFTPEGPGNAVLLMVDETFKTKCLYVELKYTPDMRRFSWDEIGGFPANLDIMHRMEVRMEENY